MVYLINTQIGFFLVNGINETEALAHYWTQDIPIEYSILDRENLLKMGYQTIQPTSIKDVFIISK